jgi:hypothetical protein
MGHMKIILSAILVIFFFMASLLYLNSCEDSPTEPEVEYGRRDYVWEEDTLDVPLHKYIIFRDIVGNSPDDVWLGNLDPGLWRYDGIKWEMTEFPGLIPSALYLFEDNTLWVGTSQEKILKIKNHILAESYTLTYQDYDRINVLGMYGKSRDNIYAVGIAVKIINLGEEYLSKGIILHYDGSTWEFLEIPELDEIGLHNIHYQENIDTYFIWGIKIEDGRILDKLFTFNGENLIETFSTGGSINLSTLNGIVYINISSEVYKYSNKELVLWKDFTGTEFVSNFVGRSENDFFNISANGIGHYNGINYKTIYTTHLDLYTPQVFNKDIFFCAKDSDNQHYIIIHGKLKEEKGGYE